MGLYTKIRTSATDVEQVIGTSAILLCPQEIETEDVGRGKKERVGKRSIHQSAGRKVWIRIVRSIQWHGRQATASNMRKSKGWQRQMCCILLLLPP